MMTGIKPGRVRSAERMGALAVMLIAAAILLQFPWQVAHLRSHLSTDAGVLACAVGHGHGACLSHNDESSPPSRGDHEECSQCEMIAQARIQISGEIQTSCMGLTVVGWSDPASPARVAAVRSVVRLCARGPPARIMA